MNVRVRFAPSPTGGLHIGGLRTALYNFLFARKHKGDFILRIEDTDQNRYVEGATDYIKETLSWLGISPDEGIDQGGEYGPYQQSKRKEIYQQYANQLIESGKAYYAFDTTEELEQMRERLKEQKKESRLYNFLTRGEMRNSLSMDKKELAKLIASGEEHVIRLKVPSDEKISFKDAIRGNVEFDSSNIDDKILIKSDGMPTYHLANVVDDHLMKITHVIRGEEWLSSTPIHVLLYQSLGWEKEMPTFAHLPLLLKPNGNGKLSKRDADKQGFPIFPLTWNDPNTGEVSEGFRERGFLPEALTNFLVFLGWNPGTEQEIFNLEQLCYDFSLERIQKGGARFDFEKAIWFNQHYVQRLDSKILGDQLKADLNKNNISYTEEKVQQAIELMRERITFLPELFSEAKYLWVSPKEYDTGIVKKKWTKEAKDGIKAITEAWQNVDSFSEDNLKSDMSDALDSLGLGPGKIMPALRLSITGTGGGPDLMKIIAFLGKDETLSRMQASLTKLQTE